MSETFKGAARTIAGRRYVLAFDFNALCALHLTHPDIMSGRFDKSLMSDPTKLRALVFEALHGQVRSEAEAGELITLIRVLGAHEWIGNALNVAFGAEDGEPVNRPPAQSQHSGGTGPKSWLSGLSWAAILRPFGIRRRAHGGPLSRVNPQP